MPEKVVSNDGTGVLGWKFKRADEIEVGDYAFLVLNTPVKILDVYPETTKASGVSVVRFRIRRPYNDDYAFVARLSHEMIVYEIREES